MNVYIDIFSVFFVTLKYRMLFTSSSQIFRIIAHLSSHFIYLLTSIRYRQAEKKPPPFFYIRPLAPLSMASLASLLATSPWNVSGLKRFGEETSGAWLLWNSFSQQCLPQMYTKDILRHDYGSDYILQINDWNTFKRMVSCILLHILRSLSLVRVTIEHAKWRHAFSILSVLIDSSPRWALLPRQSSCHESSCCSTWRRAQRIRPVKWLNFEIDLSYFENTH